MRRVTLTAVAIAAVLSTAACTGPGGQVPVNETQAPLPPAQIDQTVVLKANTSSQLGETVVDGAGYTLYRFDKDTAKPTKTNCLEDCLPKWPPLIDTGKLQVDGVDQALIGSYIRPDFERQVTIAGWPVYRFAGDTGPGDTKGQGVGGTWYAITPTGKKATGGGAAAGQASNATNN